MLKKQLHTSKVTLPVQKQIDDSISYLATVKVNQENYIPSHIKVRSRINEFLFTAEVPGNAIQILNENKKVESVALNESLGLNS